MILEMLKMILAMIFKKVDNQDKSFRLNGFLPVGM